MSIFSSIGKDLHSIFGGVGEALEGVGKGVESIVSSPFKAAGDLIGDTLKGNPLKGLSDAAGDIAGGVGGGLKDAAGGILDGGMKTAIGAVSLDLDVDTAPEQMAFDSTKAVANYL